MDKSVVIGWEVNGKSQTDGKKWSFCQKEPSLTGLHFVQIDEFYPIDPKQHNSFYDYVKNYYIEGFDLDPARALLINSDEIILPHGKHYSEVFPDNRIDLSLRNREAVSQLEKKCSRLLFSALTTGAQIMRIASGSLEE